MVDKRSLGSHREAGRKLSMHPGAGLLFGDRGEDQHGQALHVGTRTSNGEWDLGVWTALDQAIFWGGIAKHT